MKASLVQKFNLSNKIFDLNDININRDNYAYFYYRLKKEFKNFGFDLSTHDINPPTESIITLYNGSYNKIFKAKNSYLLALESPHVDPISFQKSYHRNFKKIFTWDDRLIDNIKYFKVNYSFDIPKTVPKKFEGKKLCCCIAGNKRSSHPDELYSKRVEFIRWFEKNRPDEFDLFGVDWDKYHFGDTIYGKILNRIKILRNIFSEEFPSYKGKVESKFSTMQNYRFSICYENIKDQPGYITEKIFDSFFAGCVPIYLGANNITDYIPKNCFIDKRDFKSYEELYYFIKNMDETTYIKYLNEIENYLNSPKADQFRAEVFAKTIVSEIMKDINDNS